MAKFLERSHLSVFHNKEFFLGVELLFERVVLLLKDLYHMVA